MEYNETVLRRYNGLYIETRGDIAKCYKSPLDQSKSRLQWIKTDGQGNKYVTYKKKKVLL